MMMELAFLFFARTADMCLATLRHLFVVRGHRFAAAVAAFVEILIYTTALGIMMAEAMDPLRIGVFSLGFAFGVYLGSIVESRMALGTRLLSVTVDAVHGSIADELRREGCAVTAWTASGRDGAKSVMHVLVPRRSADRLVESIRERIPGAFVVHLEPRAFAGGILPVEGARSALAFVR